MCCLYNLISRFCNIELVSTIFLNIMSEFGLRSIRPFVIRFPLLGYPLFISMFRMSSPEREEVCLESYTRKYIV